MYDTSLTPDLVERYLCILGVPRRAPGRDALAELVAAHATRVPFENISKLYYRRRLGLRGVIDAARFLEGIARHHFGGTCYTTNYYLNRLLVELGYDVKLCGADMANPDVHVVSMVRVEEREYIVDVGNAAPFLTPLPRDLADDYVIALGRDRYVLRPQDEKGRSRVESYRNGRPRHGYLAKPEPRSMEYFDAVVADSFADQATFMNALLLVRFPAAGRCTAIHNLELVEMRGRESHVTPIESRSELVHVIERHFGMPQAIVAEAIAGLGALQAVWT